PIAAGLAGATGVGLPRYIVIASAAAMAWAGTWIAVGYLLANVLPDAIAYRGFWIVVLVAVASVAFGARRSARRGLSPPRSGRPPFAATRATVGRSCAASRR